MRHPIFNFLILSLFSNIIATRSFASDDPALSSLQQLCIGIFANYLASTENQELINNEALSRNHNELEFANRISILVLNASTMQKRDLERLLETYTRRSGLSKSAKDTLQLLYEVLKSPRPYEPNGNGNAGSPPRREIGRPTGGETWGEYFGGIFAAFVIGGLLSAEDPN